VVDDERATREETASLLMNVEWFGIVGWVTPPDLVVMVN